MGEAIDIARAKDEAAAKLKRILSQFVLAMARRAGAFAGIEIILAQNMQQIGDA
jgi:hypothetical protein